LTELSVASSQFPEGKAFSVASVLSVVKDQLTVLG
jgi:hypothetical protein